MKIRVAFILIMVLLGMTSSPAQEFSFRGSFGAVSPVSRAFSCFELRHQLSPRYFLAISAELSMDESNVSPKLAVDLFREISLEAGFGWGHHWEKSGCDDHNYHTYTIGLIWTKPVRKDVSIFAGPSLFWRSYQSHIGLHRGTLRIAAGVSINL